MKGNLVLVTLLSGAIAAPGVGFCQTAQQTVSDAQIEANVLKSLAASPELANQPIKTTTVYGTVTMTGSVKDEASRDLAENVISHTADVKKVVDEMTVDAVAAASAEPAPAADADAAQGTNPNLQSDGTIASSSTPEPAAPEQPDAPAQADAVPSAPPAPVVQEPPPPARPEYAQRPYVEQHGGDAVTVPNGTRLRVRVNEEMDSQHTAVGTVFDGVVLNDVVAGGAIAIPRGAAVQGKVVDVHKAGDFKGQGALVLQLTQLTLGGRTYSLVSNQWMQHGLDKTGQTVNSAVGLGAVGALIGAVAGGGAGAAVGAGIGGVAGLGAASASKRGEAMIPSEGILAFSLTQPADLTTVSQAELNRLGAGVPAGAPQTLQRRPPPPPYYGPYPYRY
ncbi:hypothetical protein GCM10011507_05040 [Edaphobacter acidisoli]|uniref:BON domain-containing protein n=1 Tax=Edaphobacter acidisoli TaxID=2040573 RepID=A0A916W0A7_9BACT|nr:BON domain-containing protein [Edaphobacter acidisoli]GGA56715.1 hypothetical protein GCM10011507_05040 [Edaphobacter acidisoli]